MKFSLTRSQAVRFAGHVLLLAAGGAAPVLVPFLGHLQDIGVHDLAKAGWDALNAEAVALAAFLAPFVPAYGVGARPEVPAPAVDLAADVSGGEVPAEAAA